MSLLPNIGARKLAELDTIENTAAKLGASARAVSSWRSGRKVPNAQSRTAIQAAYGIDPRDFDRRELSGGDAPPLPPPTTEHSHESAEARLRAQMARLGAMRQVPDLTERARIEVERLELQASVRLARIEGQELSPRKILASAAWGQVMQVVEDTLTEASPLALFAVQDALARLAGEPEGRHVERVEAEHAALVEAVRSSTRALSAALVAARTARQRAAA